MMEIRATRQPAWWGDGIEIRILDRERRQYVKDVTLTTATEAEMIPACVNLKPEHAQQLIDQLWDCGLRPTEGTGSAGQLAATQKHLADMKEIAFHALKITK